MLPLNPLFVLAVQPAAGFRQTPVVASSQSQSTSKSAKLTQVKAAFLRKYEEKKYLESAALGLYGYDLGERGSSFLYDVACSLALSGDADRAFLFLGRAQKAGYAATNHLKEDSDLLTLHSDPRWNPLVASVQETERKRHLELTNPDRAKFVTEDIPRFWRAYDLAMAAPAGDRAAILQREYLDRASGGMKDWITVRRVTAERLIKFINASPRFLNAVRPATLNFAAQRTATIAAFRKFKDLYPEAEFPAVVFCIGGFFGGGTLSDSSLLMSGEMYGGLPNLPIDELNTWQKSVVSPNEDVSFIVAHEMIHFQQRYSADATLLRSCIQEGSADFLGELCSGSVGQFHEKLVFPYGNAHEKELWERFQVDMDRTDRQDKWLYSGSGEGVRADDLGYYMGYKICESYHKHAADKRQAVRDILTIKDFKSFLKKSRYAERFTEKSYLNSHFLGAGF